MDVVAPRSVAATARPDGAERAAAGLARDRRSDISNNADEPAINSRPRERRLREASIGGVGGRVRSRNGNQRTATSAPGKSQSRKGKHVRFGSARRFVTLPIDDAFRSGNG